MIIKIATDNTGGWQFHDNAENVLVHQMPRALIVDSRVEPIPGGRSSYHYPFLKDPSICTAVTPPGEQELITVVGFESKNNFYSIYTDYPVYLLNDSGKTIERLN